MFSFYEKFLHGNEWETIWLKREFPRNPQIILKKLQGRQQGQAIVNTHNFFLPLHYYIFAININMFEVQQYGQECGEAVLLCWSLNPSDPAAW